ncbi:hypothetical protein VNO78_35925 [Psophocarpus tetragonolobus]|uniref:Uncharacterized protein n=1 Tax=Psophocarpus tetragonolobus TaxID=3891 RepID=A0AAN9RJQ2_PSOTE
MEPASYVLVCVRVWFEYQIQTLFFSSQYTTVAYAIWHIYHIKQGVPHARKNGNKVLGLLDILVASIGYM